MQDCNEIRNNFTNLISCDANAKEAFSDCEKFFDELTEWANKQTRYTYDKEDSTKNIKKSDSIPQCPGIYFAFEEGEKIIIGGNKEYYRIVRVGQSSNLHERIMKHFRGNVDNSSFALLLGKALFYKTFYKKNYVNEKYNHKSFVAFFSKLKVSGKDLQPKGEKNDTLWRYMKKNISYVCLSLKNPNNDTNCLSCEKTRSRLELNFTKILAKSWDKNIPSEDWLGKFIPSVGALHNKLWCAVDDYTYSCVPFPTRNEIAEMRDLLGIGEK